MERFGQEFLQAGYERGLAEGEARGEAKALTRLLEMRFGAVSIRLRQRITAADLPSLEIWFDRAIQALDLHSVFGQED